MGDFGKNIALLREKKGLNQSQVTDFIKVSRNTWSDYERGRSEPNLSTIVEISDFFGVPVDWLFLPNVDLLTKLNDGKNINESIPKSRPKSIPNYQEKNEMYLQVNESEGTYLNKDSAQIIMGFMKETIKSKDDAITALKRENEGLVRENELLRIQLDECRKLTKTA